jgi:hypothetical protein
MDSDISTHHFEGDIAGFSPSRVASIRLGDDPCGIDPVPNSGLDRLGSVGSIRIDPGSIQDLFFP